MARISLVLLGLSCILGSALALDVRGKIQWNDICTGIGELGPSKVILDDGRRSGSVIQNGSFVIPDVPSGVYVLSVLSHDHQFDQLRIDILDDSSQPEIRPYTPGTPLNPPSIISLRYPISLTPRGKNEYFIPPQSFDLKGMFSNPMMLMMVFGGGMMLALPYITKNLDPELMEEIKGTQANLHKAMNGGDLKAGLSALMPSDQAASSSGVKAPAQSANKARGNKNRRK